MSVDEGRAKARMPDAGKAADQEKEDQELLRVAMTRVTADSGQRFSFEDVAAEFGIDLDSQEEPPVPKESAEPSLLDFAIARIAQDGEERHAMKAVATELGIGGTTASADQ